MTKSQFMYKLMIELSELPDEEKYIVMNDYTQFFEQQISEGIGEAEAVASLASPKEIAEGYLTGNPLPIKGIESIYNKGESGRVTAMSVFKFIALIPVAAIYIPVMSALGIACLLFVMALCVIGICVSVFSFAVMSLEVGFILTGIGGIFFAFSFSLLSVLVFRIFWALVLTFPKFMGRVLKNKQKAGHYA